MARASLIFLAVSVVAFGCSDDDSTPMMDAGNVCAMHSDCSDGVYCNGAELCRPTDSDADDFGCVAGEPPCLESQSCGEDDNRCITMCDLGADADGDGVDSMDCGGEDCDDADPDNYPGNTEICDADGHDEDCDQTTFGERDEDGDGAIDMECCNLGPDGSSMCGTDCDDSTLARRPAQLEICDEVDNDCDGEVDEEMNEVPWFRDEDGDGFGGSDEEMVSCIPIPGASLVDSDCDDAQAGSSPVGVETCDMEDDDCDGEVDEGVCMGMPDGGVDSGDVDAGDAGDVDGGDVDAGDVDAGDVDGGDVDSGTSDAGSGGTCGGLDFVACSNPDETCSTVPDFTTGVWPEGVCVPAAENGEACDPARTTSACRVEGGQLIGCADRDGDTNFTCTPVCLQGLPEGSGCQDSSLACFNDPTAPLGGGYCVTRVDEGESCDPTGLTNACESGTSCNNEGSGPICTASCQVFQPVCDAGGVCRDIASPLDAVGLCAPLGDYGDACDPARRTSACPTDSLCISSSCERTGSCSNVIDLNAVGVRVDDQNYGLGYQTNFNDSGVNDFQSIFCSETEGSDRVLAFTAPSDAFVRATVTSSSFSDVKLYLRTDCDALLSEVECSDASTLNGDAGIEQLSTDVGMGETLYFIVDGPEFDDQDFNFQLRYWPRISVGNSCDPATAENVCVAGAFCDADTEVCVNNTCGDENVDPDSEQCDDGNMSSGDGCDGSCMREVLAESENNNSSGQANSLGTASRITGMSDAAGGNDWFEIDLSDDNFYYVVEANMVPPPGLGCSPALPNITLYQPDAGTIIDQSMNPGTGECYGVTFGQFLFPGVYYLEVNGFAGTSYTVDINIIRAPRLPTSSACNSAGGDFGDAETGFCRAETDVCIGDVCVAGTCGDSIAAGGEQCDDGNAVATDGCDACALAPILESEPNTLPAIATDSLSIEGLSILQGVFGTSNDRDYWRVDITRQSTVTMAVYTGVNMGMAQCLGGSTSAGNFIVEDDEGNVVFDDSPRAEGQILRNVGGFCGILLNGTMAPGTYYIRVPGPGGGSLDPYFIQMEINPLAEVGSGEACDPTVNACSPGLGCNPISGTCTAESCGDGWISGDEECDDGNNSDGDGCSGGCLIETTTETEPNGSVEMATVASVATGVVNPGVEGRGVRVSGTLEAGFRSVDTFRFSIDAGLALVNVSRVGDSSCGAGQELFLFYEGGQFQSCELGDFCIAPVSSGSLDCNGNSALVYENLPAGDYVLAYVNGSGPATDYTIDVFAIAN